MTHLPDQIYLGEWLLEVKLNRISKEGIVKRIEPQLTAVLQLLVINQGHVVTKSDLLDTAWKDVIVTENVLTRAISSLRKVLEDDRQNPKYIETISKTGYRLIAPVIPFSKKQPKEAFQFKLVRRHAVVISGIVLLTLLGAFSNRTIFQEPLEVVYHSYALANASNTEYWPSISPDGKFAAFSWKGTADDNWDVYVQSIGTNDKIRLTDHPAPDLRARWSSDGVYIYYLRYEKEGATIYKKSLLGAEETRITDAPNLSSGDFDISPDEKWISFNSRTDPEDPSGITLISLDLGTRQILTYPTRGFKGDIHPTFSQDGKTLAFIREKNPASMHLWLYDLDSATEIQITDDHQSINGFDWSSDGRSLIYGSNKSGMYKLWKVSIDQQQPKMMPVTDDQMVMPRVAKSGQMIYAKMKDNVNIWAYQLDDKTAQPWQATNDLNLNPNISSDGIKVCFTQNFSNEFQIWTANMDGTGIKPITNFDGQYISTPRWSTDGQRIVFQGYKDGQSDIFVVNALGGIPLNITNSTDEDHTPIFSSRSQKVYYSSNRNGVWGIWVKTVDENSKPHFIIGNNAYAPQLKSDNTTLLYCRKDTTGIWAYDLNTKKERLLVKDFHPMYSGAFTLCTEGIYYFNARNRQIEYSAFDSGKSQPIYRPQKRLARLGATLSISNDESTLLFTQVDDNDADIMSLEKLN